MFIENGQLQIMPRYVNSAVGVLLIVIFPVGEVKGK
jgi:hypothetical protein